MTEFNNEQGFVFPPEAGYPLDPNQARFYLMETHYNNPRPTDGYNSNVRQKADSSGLKIYYTEKLRKFDAGVLSIGKLFVCFILFHYFTLPKVFYFCLLSHIL